LRDPFFLRCWPRSDAALAAVVADAVDAGIVHDHRSINVCIVNDRGIHIEDSGVIEKSSSLPAAADETCAEVAEAIVDAAIKSDFTSPEAFVEHETATFPAPPARRP
jgi:hypothetical protein